MRRFRLRRGGSKAEPEELEPSPPGEREVACRALCLGSLIGLGYAAHDARVDEARRPEAEEAASRLREWLRAEGLAEHQSARERALFGTPLDAWTERDFIDASWRSESTGVLLWALSFLDELPPWDSQIEEPGELPFLQPIAGFLADARLRPADEIERARSLAELWHWRSRTRQLQGDEEFAAANPELDLDEIVRLSSQAAAEEGDIPAPVEGDFPLFGRAYRDLTEDEYALATSIAMERHFALNWLAGYSADWDETPTDT